MHSKLQAGAEHSRGAGHPHPRASREFGEAFSNTQILTQHWEIGGLQSSHALLRRLHDLPYQGLRMTEDD